MSAPVPSPYAIAHRLALVGIDAPEWGPANHRLKEALQAAGVTISSPGGSLYRRLTVLLAEWYDPSPEGVREPLVTHPAVREALQPYLDEVERQVRVFDAREV